VKSDMSAAKNAGASYHGDAKLLAGVIVGTFAVLRLWLAITPNADLTVRGVNVHHLFTGVLLTTIAAVPLVVVDVASRRLRRWLIVAFGVGLALMLDEWVYLIATDGSNAAYATPVSRWGGLALVLLGAGYAWACGRVGRVTRATPSFEPDTWSRAAPVAGPDAAAPARRAARLPADRAPSDRTPR
jgi:hypothetical protein